MVLSLLSDCPTFTFYVLEIIVNTAMIAEVSIRLVAFGKVSSLVALSRASSLTRSPTAILEILLQYFGSGGDGPLWHHHSRHFLLGLLGQG